MTCLDSINSTSIHFDRFRASVDLTVITFIIVSNCFIIFAVIRDWRQHGMPLGNMSSTYLVINLSVADGLVGVFGIFYFLPRYLCSLSDDLGNQFTPCILRFALIIFAHLGSGYTVIFIAIDRYIAVLHAVRYAKLLKKERIFAMIAAIWGCAAIGAFILFVWNNWELGKGCKEFSILPVSYVLVVGLLGQFIILTVVSFTHWKIHRIAISIHNRNQELSITEQMNTRSARALLWIVGIYTVTWSPFMIFLIIRTSSSNVEITQLALELASSLVNVNYVVNPLTYAYNNRPVRKAMSCALKMLKFPNPFHDATSFSASN